MNKWKFGFWSCLFALVIVIILSVYTILDQAYTLTYHKADYTSTESDFDHLIKIINDTDLSKNQIEDVLKNHSHYNFMDFENDTISLNKITLIFERDKLERINN